MFLGAVNYLQTFVPYLSSNTEPLWALLKKENCFAWDENTNTCFQKIKSQLQKALLRPLRYYDQSKLVTLQCEASLKGLGACIIQDRQLIPPSCRDDIMADLHGSHASINKAMDLARTCVYWPSIEADITTYSKWCLTCIKCSNLPVKMLKPHKVPPRPWVKIGVDFFQDHLGKKHLIVADYFSKFPYMFPVASAHHFKTITHLRELFAAEDVPTVVMSDNGTFLQ